MANNFNSCPRPQKFFFKKCSCLQNPESRVIVTMMKKSELANLPTVSQNTDSILKHASVFDRDDPDSVWNRTQGALRTFLEKVEQNKTGIRNTKLPPAQIKNLIKPEPRDAKLRLAFWEEYARAVDRDSFIRIEYIGAGVTSQEIVMDMLMDPEKFGYVLNCPASYLRETENLLHVALDRLRDILDLPLVNSKGQVQPAVVAGILKAAEMLDKRVKGSVMQKVAVHQHHTQGGAPIGFDGTLAQDQLLELEKQLSDVRKKMTEKYAILPSPSRNGDLLVEKAQDEET